MKRNDKIIIRAINYKGIVTSLSQTCYFYGIADPKLATYIVSLDNPDKNRHFEIRHSDILRIYDGLTHELIYQKKADDAL